MCDDEKHRYRLAAKRNRRMLLVLAILYFNDSFTHQFLMVTTKAHLTISQPSSIMNNLFIIPRCHTPEISHPAPKHKTHECSKEVLANTRHANPLSLFLFDPIHTIRVYAIRVIAEADDLLSGFN